jgi:macrolide transport system ATP-binding/permease protein
MFTALKHMTARVRAVFGSRNLDRDFAQELESHVAMLTEDNIRRGMTHDEARRAALIRVGAGASLRDQHREARGLPALDSIVQDMRFGIRQLAKHRGFARTAILVLSLGIGANVAIFGFVDAALIKPLPYENPSRLVAAFGTRPDRSHGQTKNFVSYLNFLEWRERNRVFSSIAAFDVREGFTLTNAEGEQRVPGLRVTSGFFRTLGVTPARGREFHRSEEGLAARPTVVLAHSAWQNRFGGRPDILGQTVILQGERHVVIGVLPRNFYFPMAAHAEFWAAIRGPQTCWEARGCRSLEAVARLADGVSIETARSALSGLMQQLRDHYGDSNPESTTLVPLPEMIFRDLRPIILMISSGAGLLLLIASINVVSLLLARSDSRTREMAVRNALGASNSRLLTQFATEAAILVAASSLVGLALAAWGMQFLSSLLSTDMISRMPYFQGLSLNIRMIAFTFALCLIAVVIFALTPLTRISGAKRFAALKEGSRGSVGMTWRRLGRSLVVAELAIAVILLVGAGLLSKSVYRLLHVDTGFNTRQLAIMTVTPVSTAPRTENSKLNNEVKEQPGALARQVAQRVAASPGVQAVGYADLLPLGAGLAPSTRFQVPGRPEERVIEDHPVRRISAGYFTALQATLLAGRFFTEVEVASRRRLVIINGTAAKRYFPGEDAIGKQIVIGAPPARLIVGVVADIKDGPLETPAHPAAYVPFDQIGFALVARTSQSELATIPSIGAVIREVRPDLLVQGATTMNERMNRLPSASLKRATAWLVGGFAATALLLSLVGLYGVIVYSVGQRTREIGVRMALGAQRRSVYQLVVGEAVTMVIAGTVLGVIGAVGAATLMGHLLFGVEAWDVSTLVAAVGVLAIPAFFASFLPARRAASVNPLEALRTE